MTDEPAPRARRVIRYALATGIVAALLATGWGATLGGGLALGRLDPLFSLPGRVLVGAVLAIVIRDRRRGEKWIAGLTMLAASLAIDALLGTVAAGRFAWQQAALALVVQATAWSAAQALLEHNPARYRVRAPWLVAAGAIVLAAMPAWVLPALYAARSAAEPIRVAIVSGVPLEWDGPVDMTTILSGRAQASPLLPALAERFAIDRLDAIDAGRLKRADVVVLAHPRPLSPAELVALDSWVRDGGSAIVLADALLSWPPDYPIGDPRNPPITSLLSPLLDHWGLDLAAPPDDTNDVFMVDGYRVDTVSTGRFSPTGNNCVIALDGRTAQCRLGRGRAMLVADADLLNPALWSGTSPGPVAWRAGNLDWIIAMIGEFGPRGRTPVFAPSWRVPKSDRGDSATSEGKLQEQGENFADAP